MARGEDTRNHPGRGVGRTEIRGMTKQTLADGRSMGYSHPTGPTTFFGDQGAKIARQTYRDSRNYGLNQQDARSYAIRQGIIRGRDSEKGSYGTSSQDKGLW